MDQQTGGGTGGDEARRQEVMDHLTAALDQLKTAIKDLGDEVEQNARAEWVRAKPELRANVSDLQGLVDTLAERAKAAIGDLSNRLDPPGSREDGRS